MKLLSRRNFLLGTAGLVLTAGGIGWYILNKKMPIGFKVKEETVTSGRALLKKIISVDIHAHPGRSFVEGAINLDSKIKQFTTMGSFEEKTIADMLTGGQTMASFSTVADFQILGLDKNKGGLYSF